MSVLETPRLIFRGQVSWDPIVTNNYNTYYDEDGSQTVFSAGQTDVATFRKAAIDGMVDMTANPPSSPNWNVDGTHRSVFFDTVVTGVDLGAGPSTDDPIVNCPVLFEGMLVDLDPYSLYSSQLFFDEMSFGIPGGCRVLAPRTTRMTARYINFSRSPSGVKAGVASVVWQTSFPKAGLRVDPHRSAALAQLLSAMEADDVLGLTVRWNAYRTIYFDDPSLSNSNQASLAVATQALQTKLRGGGFQPNPARSLTVGVLGLWRQGEPVGEPGDRALLTCNSKTIASAHARFGTDSLTLDLSNSIPETGGADLAKVDLGTLTVNATNPLSKTVQVKLGSFGYDAYDRDAYLSAAGLVTLKVDPSLILLARLANLSLTTADGTTLLAEQPLRAIPAAGNTYLDEGQTGALQVQVLDRGVPAGSGVTVKMMADAAPSASPDVQLTDAQGIATFPLKGNTGNVEGFVLVAGAQAEIPSTIDTQSTTYAYIRTRPADADTAGLPPTWDNVHEQVLRNWQAMAPCMDNWLDLGDADQVRAFAGILKKLTDGGNFEAYRFMPVTRDMTAGERTLLYRFLDASPTPSA